MMQLPGTAPARRTGGARSAHGVPVAADHSDTARVTVTWTPSKHDDAPRFTPSEIELVAELEVASTATWTCSQRFASNWLEAIASARCGEVVLTARLDDNPQAKHVVLELAELLTVELAATQPLIRVRFLPTASERRNARRPA
jgi:hypothetical protein